MLIRLVAHYVNNPGHIDKLICIKGLPEEWFFKPAKDENGNDGKSLVHPWEADIDANIPNDIRHLCDPFEHVIRRPPIAKGEPWNVFTEKALGVKLNFMTEPGHEMWEKIERYLEASVPRDQRIPDPVLVAIDKVMPFSTYRARRNMRGSLEFIKSDIPVIDVRQVVATPKPEPVPQIVVPVQAKSEGFSCSDCKAVFEKERALKMHRFKKHSPEKVGA